MRRIEGETKELKKEDMYFLLGEKQIEHWVQVQQIEFVAFAEHENLRRPHCGAQLSQQ